MFSNPSADSSKWRSTEREMRRMNVHRAADIVFILIQRLGGDHPDTQVALQTLKELTGR